MGTADEIQSLRQRGMTDGEIIGALKSKGVPESEIVNSLSQSKIKDAVSAPDSGGNFGSQGRGNDQTMAGTGYQRDPTLIAGQSQNSQQGYGNNQGVPSSPNSPPMMQGGQMQESMQSPGMTQESFTPPAMQQAQYGSGDYSGMQPSMMTPGGGDYAGSGGGEYAPSTSGGAQEYVQGGGMAGDYAYDQYQSYQDSMSTDIITEIAEQVVNEKLSYLRDRLEGVLDVRTVMDARMTNLNERMKRIEKILDQLQLSVLQKVGEYVNDVKDIKKEMEETQKSFTALHKKKHSKK